MPKEPSGHLSSDREVSSIPRALPTNHDRHTLNAAEAAAIPANSESDTGHDRTSGNWIYPSQHMFFEAMKRKGHTPTAADMQTIVPIHNAVNERAWSAIQRWEDAYSKHCGGPKLVSFSGDSKKLTPRARWRSFVGYEAPFDRHDWVVDRCGKRVEYVIDFYSGKQDGMLGGMGPSFYLDVRPKLNSWEGVKTRAWKVVGS
jgi:cytochrome c heme-lyase